LLLLLLIFRQQESLLLPVELLANTDYTLAADGTISFSAGMADAAPIPANRAQVYIFGSLAVPLKPNTRYLLSIASLNGADVYFNVGSGKAAVSNPWGPAPVIPSVNDGAMLADKKTNTFEFTTPAAVGTDHWFAIYYCSGSIGTSKVHFHMCEVV
jgi:hypothetical protein